jgi:hypothetical protein
MNNLTGKILQKTDNDKVLQFNILEDTGFMLKVQATGDWPWQNGQVSCYEKDRLLSKWEVVE